MVLPAMGIRLEIENTQLLIDRAWVLVLVMPPSPPSSTQGALTSFWRKGLSFLLLGGLEANKLYAVNASGARSGTEKS